MAILGAADRVNYWDDEPDYFTQAGNLSGLMSAEQQQVLFENTARNMHGVPDEIKLNHVCHCRQANPAYGVGVLEVLDVALPK